jgi:hypothetical protein
LEDSGKLDLILASEGIPITNPRSSVAGMSMISDSSTGSRHRSGVLSAHATSKFIRLEWEQAALDFNRLHNSFLITMDGEPIYVGAATEYIVESSDVDDPGHHLFALYKVPNDRRRSSDRRASLDKRASMDYKRASMDSSAGDGWERLGELYVAFAD